MSKSILIVEYEETLRESIQRIFLKEGYAVEAVDSAEKGLALLETSLFDIIISDIILPGMDGIAGSATPARLAAKRLGRGDAAVLGRRPSHGVLRSSTRGCAMKGVLVSPVLVALLVCGPAFASDIHQAARKGDVETVQALLAAHPELVKTQNLQVGDFWLNGTPLHWAASKGHRDVVELLLAHNADVNARAVNTLGTPLHCAAGFGRTEVAELLLANKAAVDAKGKDHNTPLHLAAANYPKEVVELLSDAGTPERKQLSFGQFSF